MLRPSERHCRMAGTPSAVPGILIITLGRLHWLQRRCASAIVARVSRARWGPTSIETKPSLPPLASKTGRNWSAAAPTSATARLS